MLLLSVSAFYDRSELEAFENFAIIGFNALNYLGGSFFTIQHAADLARHDRTLFDVTVNNRHFQATTTELFEFFS